MKAILVIDEMPMDCGACMLGACDDEDFESAHIRCYAHRYTVGDESADMFSKPSWCPLKPMPKEEDIYEVGMDEEDTNAKRQWNKGWDACLKEIEK